MSSWKRGRVAESDSESDTTTPTTKRTRLDAADPSGSTCHRTDHHTFTSCLLNIWSQPMTERQKKFLTMKMDGLSVLKSAAIFIEPHTAEHMPIFLRKIKASMYLPTLRDHLDSGEYSSVTDLFIDFRAMIDTVVWINDWNNKDSASARRLWKCFIERMEYCPIGLDEKPMAEYDEHAIRLMASKITDISTTASTTVSEKFGNASIDESCVDKLNKSLSEREADRPEDAFGASNVTSHELECNSLVDNPISPTSMQDEPPHVSNLEAAKTLKPSDQDEEARQLSKEIEECQQKLAKMLRKKKLLAEIRDLDTEKEAIEREIPGIEEQYERLSSKFSDYNARIDTVMGDEAAAVTSRDWHVQESARLQQESERLRRESKTHQHESERLRSVADECKRKMETLESERNQVEDKSSHFFWKDTELKNRLHAIEGQRAVAEMELDELNNPNYWSELLESRL